MDQPQHLSRRHFIDSGVLSSVGIILVGFSPAQAKTRYRSPGSESLDRLLAGNQRFVDGKLQHPGRQPSDFVPLASGQKPIAAIVGCADSRVPPEVLFDQGVGDLFVIRIAGNYVSGAGASVKGSVEYAVAELKAPLILVLGHSQCGAVKAAIQQIDAPGPLPGSINELVNQIKPAVASVKNKPGNLLENAIASNVERSVAKLKGLEPILAPAVRNGSLQVAGAYYELSTGKVKILA